MENVDVNCNNATAIENNTGSKYFIVGLDSLFIR